MKCCYCKSWGMCFDAKPYFNECKSVCPLEERKRGTGMTLDKYLTIAECLPKEQEPCEDAISRQAAIDAIYACYVGGKDAVDKAPLSNRYAEGISEAVCAVEDLPSVQPSISIQITEREKYGRFN